MISVNNNFDFPSFDYIYPMTKSLGEGFPLGNPSTSCAEEVFAWLVSPNSVEDFLSQIWERKPLLVSRNLPDHHSGILSRKMIENYANADADFAANSLILSREGDEGREIISGSDIDVSTINTMINEDGFDLQAVHPQHKNAKLQALLERLENFTGSLWGSNYYFKQSKSSSTFSDNVELFILQIDGISKWKVYQGEQELSRDSGSDYDVESLGLPIIDEALKPGDLLYIPRGMIYTSTVSNDSSHVSYLSLSTYQNQSWCDFLSTLVSETLESVTRKDVDFRRGLPMNYLSLFGCAMVETDTNKSARDIFKSTMSKLLHTLIDSIDLDDIVDQMGSDFMALRTPPVARKRKGEDTCSTFGPDPRLVSDIVVRVRNPNWIRTVRDSSESLLVFSCMQNEIANHMRTDNPLDSEPLSFEIHGAERTLESFQDMMSAWPKFVPIGGVSREVTGELWEAGILETRDSSKVLKN